MYLSIFLLVSGNLSCIKDHHSCLILPLKSLVVSSLISLMGDQVSHLKEPGLKVANMSSLENGERTRVESGEYSLVYGSPEAWLKNERWRFMLTNSVYSTKLCAIAVDEAHVVRLWQVFN